MKILHMLSDGPTDLSTKIIDAQKKDNDVKVIDLSKDKAYESVVDAIFSSDKVVCW